MLSDTLHSRKNVIRYSLIAISVVLGAAVHTGNFDFIEVQYQVPIQQAALHAGIMSFFVAYAYIGDSIVWIGLTLLLLAYDFRGPRKALKLALFVTIIAMVVTGLRLAFPRQRPFDKFPQLVQTFAYEGLPSYPSGHVAPAAGGFFLLANHSRLLNVVFGAMVFLLALSRLATGTHYITDLIGAGLFSYPIAAIIDDLKVFERFKKR
jgi:membrane-associated phospholipid phosphatase